VSSDVMKTSSTTSYRYHCKQTSQPVPNIINILHAYIRTGRVKKKTKPNREETGRGPSMASALALEAPAASPWHLCCKPVTYKTRITKL
jgi:hypothetical protein